MCVCVGALLSLVGRERERERRPERERELSRVPYVEKKHSTAHASLSAPGII